MYHLTLSLWCNRPKQADQYIKPYYSKQISKLGWDNVTIDKKHSQSVGRRNR